MNSDNNEIAGLDDAEPIPSWEQAWQRLVTSAMLGVDRRDPPIVEIGVVSDFVNDTVAPDPARRLLAAVAATAAARRAGFTPLAAAPVLARPQPDPRPLLPVSAVTTARWAIDRWTVLEDEWLIEVINTGWRLPADMTVAGLARTQADPLRRARVVVAAGADAEWLSEVFPALSPKGRQRPPDDDILSVPDDLSPDVAGLATLDALTFVDRLTARILQGEGSETAERKILTTLMARARPAVLVDAADALDRLGTTLTIQLRDLARTRHLLLESLADLGPAPHP